MADLNVESTLYVVSTPIGNLGDMTYRAVETLRTAAVVFAEDTRRTSVLLSHYDIQAKLLSAHEHNEAARAETAMEILGEGRDVALVTDAGTPLLSDPGAKIARAALNAGFGVVPVPGASALLAALVASGISADRFTFYGFIPRKGGSRAKLLGEIARAPHTAVLYESPHRTADLLRDLRDAAGSTRRVAVARELTKLHEEVFRGTLDEAVERLQGVAVRGEIAVVVEGAAVADDEEDAVDPLAARLLARALLNEGQSASAVARELRDRLGMRRNAAYELVQRIHAGESESDDAANS